MDLTWEQLKLEYATSLADSLTSVRVPVLKAILQSAKAGEIAQDDLKEVSLALLKTYNYYLDVNSRNAVLEALESIAGQDEKFLSVFVKFINQTVSKARSAPSDYLTLLAWINRFVVLANDDLIPTTIQTQALIFNKALDVSGPTKHRKRVFQSVLVSTKTSLVESFSKHLDHEEKYLKSIVDEVIKLPLDVALPYFGILTSSTQDALPVQPIYSDLLQKNFKSQIVDFFANQGLLGKAPPSAQSMEVFGAFVEHLTEEDYKVLLPNIEKSILRSSENSFVYTLPAFYKSVSEDIDVLADKKLISSILSNVKSTKENVRLGAFLTLKHISQKNTTEEHALGFVKDIVTTLKSSSNVDIKALVGETLAFIKKGSKVSAKILLELCPLMTKDQNEISLLPLVTSFIYHAFKVIFNSELDPSQVKTVVAQIKSGLADKKIPLRRIWFTEVGEALLVVEKSDSVLDFVKEISSSLKTSLEEAFESPLPVTANKGILCAYVALVILSMYDVFNGFSQALSNGEKPAILTSPKVYTKLTTKAEFTWAPKALKSSSKEVSTLNDSAKADFGLSWVYFLTSLTTPKDIKLQIIKDIADILKDEEGDLISQLLVDAIYSTVGSTETDIDIKGLAPLLVVMTQVQDNEELVRNNLGKLFVIANCPKLPVKNAWVGLAQRSTYNIDIGLLLKEKHEFILNQINSLLLSSQGALYDAAVKAVGMAAFICPDLVGPILAKAITNDINTDPIDDESLKIWRAPEGELVVDVLNQSNKKVEDKNSKDYEIKKWEESLKKDISSKNKGKPAKKLTKEETIKVNEQLALESKVRSEVENNVKHTKKSIAIIVELANNAAQVDNGSVFWFPVAIGKLLSLMKSSSLFELFGDSPIACYLNLSKLVSPRLGLLTKFIGVATIRVYDIEGLDSEYKEEPLLDLIGRLLFRIKILSDQSPLDSLSLAYILPLLTKVLENGKAVAYKNSTKQAVTSEFVEEDPEEEQLLLAVEIVSSHAEAFEDEYIPRVDVLTVLISLMKLPSKAKIAKESFLSLCQHISVNISKGDLKLLMDSLITPNVFVRTTILEGIDSEFDLTNEMNYSNELWISAHASDASAEIANTIWQDNDFVIVEDAATQLLEFAANEDSGLRLAVAKAIVSAVHVLAEKDTSIISSTLEEMINLYHVKKNPPAPKLDKYGLPIKSKNDNKDTWEERSTLALAFKLSSPVYGNNIERFFRFLVDEQALGDKDDLVRQELLEAGATIINDHGKENIEVLISIFEAYLAVKDKKATKTENNIKEGVIILYGDLARHLSLDDARLEGIISRLLETLDTPSERVQYAISECIAPLVKSFDVQVYLDSLFEKLFNGKTLASRRGAAHGIAGLVKGVGIKSLSTHDIIRTLVDASEDKKNAHMREGVSFAFECLSQSLGKFFEPYVIEVLPIILKSLGDTAPEVRLATDNAAKVIMKNTTSFGVKKLIPLAISNLEEIAWRSKKGSVELLGSMAYLDPTQLSASLSTIVPEIVGVLNDTHKEVRKAADLSLKRFGEVIRNPEIQAIVPDLINAIGDPTKYTDSALDKLIGTQFVHYIDGPSLALIIHVIHRGMKERSAATKKKACQIVGNMAILVDAKDLRPYLQQLVNELEYAMVDPVPATRSTAARALGSLVERLGEEQFPDLIPRLLDTLLDETKTGDRLGSAQALSEVICGLGVNKLEELLPSILSNATSTKNHIRAAYITMLLFLPVCFGSQFAPYLSKIIPPILNGLADSDEEIRDTALRAGRLIVKNYAKKAVDLLLPELELGLSDVNYRIRLSSVELTGDLLFQITGISGKNELTEEDTTGEVQKNLVEILGQGRRDRVLASLFVCRSDVSGIVRNASVDIWKALVSNTPRTVKEILPDLTSMIITKLASKDADQRKIAAQTLGEMIRRIGANALAQLLPTLEESLHNSDVEARQGICIAINELILSTQLTGLVEYQDVFIRIIRGALVDPSVGVRTVAAQAFENLQDQLGKVVIDEIIPHLLNMLEGPDSENALLALREIMAMKADTIFPILIPTLLTPPIDAFKAKALSLLASVAGSALYRRLPLIINTLITAVMEAESTELIEAFDTILLSIEDDEGVHPLMQQILSLIKHEDSGKRAVIYQRLGNFFANTSLDYSVYLTDMLGQFILSLGDPSPKVVEGTFDALNALVKRQGKDTLDRLVKPSYQALELTGVKGEDLAGFCLPKGPNCILPIFLHGLMYGNSDQKEISALGIADIIDKTPSANLKPFVTNITGPLIRVIGEKVSSDIKSAILVALNNLLVKIGQFLRPFIPQLQRTFVRSLSDGTNETLRDRAVVALGALIKYQPRVDSLVAELVSGAKNADNQGVKTSMLKGMLEAVNKAGNNMSEASKTSIMALVEEEITVVGDKSAVSYARLLGALSKILSTEEASEILKTKILKKDGDKFSILSINSFLRYSPSHIFKSGLLDEITSFVIGCANSTEDYISDNATVAIGKMLLLVGEKKSIVEDDVESPEAFEMDDQKISKLMDQMAINCLAPKSSSPDTRRLSLVVIRTVARLKYAEVMAPTLDVIAPSVFLCIRDPNIPVKLAAEKAFLAVFDLIDDVDMQKFKLWFEGKTSFQNALGAQIVPRSIGDYTKRVGSRLAGVERERIEAGGDAETMFSDRFEDENEVWSVGGVEMKKE